MKTYYVAQENLHNALWWPRWEENLREGICIHMANSLCCTAENNTLAKQLHSNKNFF